MNDMELGRLIAEQARVRDDDVAGWDLAGADVALRERIVTGGVAGLDGPAAPAGDTAEPTAEPVVPASARAPWPSPRPARLVAAVAAAAVLAAGLLVATPFVGARGESAYAAQVLARAQESPRLLVKAGGWKVTYVDERDRLDGEMKFAHGTQRAQINWYPVGYLDDYVGDRAASYGAPRAVRFLGRPASLFAAGHGRVEVVGVLDGERMLDVMIPSDALDAVREVGVQEWLDALPDSTFNGGRRSAAIDGMLVGLPLPPGYDPVPLRNRGLASDRYQLGAAVVQSVGCVWFDRWFAARERGDDAAADEVSRVLRGSREWPVLRAMASSGGYPQVFWGTSDATSSGFLYGGKDVALTRQVVSAELGCRL